MTWFKVDDKLHDHRKARAAGKGAMGVWVLAGSWSADNLTDGFIPPSILTRFGTKRDAERLVSVGLWHVAEQYGETGWRFHEWDERQPTRAQKMAERLVRAEAGKAGGLASGRSRRQANPKQDASPRLEPPSRPDPSLHPSDVERDAAAAAHTPRKGTRLPDGWNPEPDLIDAMRTECPGIDLQAEHRKFTDYWRAKTGRDATKLDWAATWRNWIRNARPTTNRGTTNGVDWEAAMARAEARDREAS